jgi:predicted ArsR family transcriptional regulator
MSPGDLAAALHVPAPRLRYHLGQLIAQGTLVGSGTTSTRRIALAEPSAKEGP